MPSLYKNIYTNIRLWYNGIETNELLKEEFEDTKGVIRIRISKKNRQHNDQKKKYKTTNNDLQNIHIKLARKSGNVDFSKLINTELQQHLNLSLYTYYTSIYNQR